jgi:hypothetical protein
VNVTHAGTPQGCHPIPVTWYSPTGIAGCRIYGEGIASTWGGPGAARNDCVYPWRDCQTVAVTSLTTGLRIIVTPTMYCDCYTGTRRQRLIDLDPAMVRALGLDPADGLWPVTVYPVDASTGLPDTSTGGPR